MSRKAVTQYITTLNFMIKKKEDILHGPRWQVIYFTTDYDDKLISYITHHSNWQIAHDTALLPEVN